MIEELNEKSQIQEINITIAQKIKEYIFLGQIKT